MKAEKVEIAHLLRQEPTPKVSLSESPGKAPTQPQLETYVQHQTMSVDDMGCTATQTVDYRSPLRVQYRETGTTSADTKGYDPLPDQDVEHIQLCMRNKRLEQELKRVKREMESLRNGEESSRMRINQLVAALQEANAKIADQRQQLDDFAMVKCDMQRKLKQEYEQREKELTAKYVREKEAAAALLAERDLLWKVQGQKVRAAQTAVDERWRARLKMMEDHHKAEVEGLQRQRQQLEDMLQAKLKGQGADNEAKERWTLQKEIGELKRRLKLEMDLPQPLPCVHCGRHCSGECCKEKITELQQQLQDLRRAKESELEEKDRSWEQRWKDRETMSNTKHAEVVGHIRGMYGEQLALAEAKLKAKEAEQEERLMKEREAAQRERQSLIAEHSLKLSELRLLLQEEREELESHVRTERAARLAAETHCNECMTEKEREKEIASKKEVLLHESEDLIRRLETRLRESESKILELHHQQEEDEVVHHQQLEREKRNFQAQLESQAVEKEQQIQAKNQELRALRTELEKEQKRIHAEKHHTINQLSEVMIATKDLEAKHAVHIQELERRHERKQREIEDQCTREKDQALRGLKLRLEEEHQSQRREWEAILQQQADKFQQDRKALEEELKQQEAHWADLLHAKLQDLDLSRSLADREANDILASRELECANRIRQITDECHAQVQRAREEAEGRFLRLQAQYDAKCKDLEDCKRDLRESDSNFKELERQLREVFARLEKERAADTKSEALKHKVASLEVELQEQKEEAARAWKRAKEVDNQCKVLKERLRELTNDLTTQKMFPLIGVEITEGNVLHTDLRHQGVNILSVRGPAQRAGLEVDDLIQHLEIHHSAVIHDLYDFKQCVDKVRPGDIVTATVLRRGTRLSKSLEVEASFTNPYKRHTYKKVDSTSQPQWVSRLTNSAV